MQTHFLFLLIFVLTKYIQFCFLSFFTFPHLFCLVSCQIDISNYVFIFCIVLSIHYLISFFLHDPSMCISLSWQRPVVHIWPGTPIFWSMGSKDRPWMMLVTSLPGITGLLFSFHLSNLGVFQETASPPILQVSASSQIMNSLDFFFSVSKSVSLSNGF